MNSTVSPPPTVLLIEDSLTDTRHLQQLLEMMGCCVTAVETAREGSRLAMQLTYRIIFCDLHLPDGWGQDIIRALLADGVARHTPVIVTTSNNEARTMRELLQLGVADYLVKPVEALTLRKVLSGLLNGPSAGESGFDVGYVTGSVHDLRSPLTTMTLATQLLRQEIDPGNGNLQELINKMESATQAIENGLESVLELGRLAVRGHKLEPCALSLIEFGQELVRDFRWQIQESHSVSLQMESGLTTAWLDAEVIRNILLNLLSNAVKYSAPGSPVLLRMRTQARDLVLSVEDCGIGIPEDQKRFLFEPGRRLSNVGDVQGTGWGLYMVRRYLVLMGGDIQVRSQMGTGSTFEIRLPLLAQPALAEKI